MGEWTYISVLMFYVLALNFSLGSGAQPTVRTRLYQQKFRGGRFNGTLIVSVPRISLSSCAVRCLSDLRCQSFNFVRVERDPRERICEKLATVPENLTANMFQLADGAGYYETYTPIEPQETIIPTSSNASLRAGSIPKCFSTTQRQKNKSTSTYAIVTTNLCYFLFLNESVWRNCTTANATCKALGGFLAEPKSDPEYKLVLNTMLALNGTAFTLKSAQITWIGSSGYGSYSPWYWHDGQQNTYDFWGPYDPNSPTTPISCAGILQLSPYHVIDRVCTDPPHGYICEYHWDTVI